MSNPVVLIVNGPNLNMLGTRQPEIYGTATLADLNALCARHAETLNLTSDFRQSNYEGDLVTWIQEAKGRASGIIVNAGGLTHSSVSILDALLTVQIPTIEVHLSNIHQREEFRHTSYVSRAAKGMICGLGTKGYLLALDALADIIGTKGA